MIKIIKFLVFMLMSMSTSVVVAQTPKINLTDRAKLSEINIAHLKYVLSGGIKNMSNQDSLQLKLLLENDNTPLDGVVGEDGIYDLHCIAGDKYLVYISERRGCFWLTYQVWRKDELVGRLDINIY